MTLLLTLLLACDTGTLTIEDAVGTPSPEETDRPDVTPETPPADDEEPPPVDSPTDTEPPPLPPVGDPSAAGPDRVTTRPGSYATRGCTLNYITYEPEGGASNDVAVILSHGFMRDRSKVAVWARRLASWGFTVVTPNLCHATITDADHAQNGRDLADLANAHLGDKRAIYVGHSAGGLASVLAAVEDTDAIGVFGLDIVDTDDLGKNAARRVRVPLRGLIADPSWSCNLDNNGLAIYERAPDAAVWRVADTTHCDFENPTDGGCTTLCGWQFPGPAFTDVQQRNTITAMLVSYAFWVSGLDTRYGAWWTPGAPEHDALRATGLLETP